MPNSSRRVSASGGVPSLDSTIEFSFVVLGLLILLCTIDGSVEACCFNPACEHFRAAVLATAQVSTSTCQVGGKRTNNGLVAPPQAQPQV